MPFNLTVDQVIAMAPDAASAKSGKDLASPRKWASLGCNEDCAWGECQGSGALPYQTRVDLADLTFKCTCPSRKFPCKHSLALLLLFVEQQAAFTQIESPSWVDEWLSARRSRLEKKAKKLENGDKPVDAVAQAKRLDKRQEKVTQGIAELDRWLQDAIRQGLATMKSKPYSFWEDMAARLVDCQAPGLARLVRDCAGIPSTGEGWQERLLEELGSLYLIVEAYGRLSSLPADLQRDVKSIIGFTVNQDELLKSDGIKDTWEIVGQRVEQEDRLRVQRTWLYGRNSKRWALVINFAHGMAVMDSSLVIGNAIDAELVFFPAALPLRALVKSKFAEQPLTDMTAVGVSAALEAYAHALARNPWLERFPMALSRVTPRYDHDGGWWLIDETAAGLKMTVLPMSAWQMMALGGGKSISVFGEWDGRSLAPLAVSADKALVRIH
ncbi:MAG TPA: SWIM zinc finger family protein [Candidatus Obscuribacterales bacterium]